MAARSDSGFKAGLGISRRVLALATLALWAGCARQSELARPVPHAQAPAKVPSPVPAQVAAPGEAVERANRPPAQEKNFALVEVYFATDRGRTGQSDPSRSFDGTRGTLSFGVCEVSLPRDPRLGKLEGGAVVKLESREGKSPTLRRTLPRERAPLVNALKGAVGRSGKRSALVFVHGYNVGFAEAARRSAQLKYDLAFDGAAIFFSWPSNGKPEAYRADEADVEWAQPDLKDLLKEVAGKTRARNIYLIGQGMGARALAKAYVYLVSEAPELAGAFRELILVAPDLEADAFRQDLAPALAEAPARTTIYASSNDPGLRASGRFRDHPRAGDSGARLTLYDGIDTVDASRVSTSLSGHSYIGDNGSVLADIYRLITSGKPAAQRHGLKTVDASSGRYWKLRAK